MVRGIVNLNQGARAAGGPWRNPVRNLGKGLTGDGDREGGGGDSQVIAASRNNPREAFRSVSEGEAVVTVATFLPKGGEGVRR